MSDQNIVQSNKPKLERSGIVRIITVVGFLLAFGVILFCIAGRLDWWGAWAFLIIYILSIMANSIWTLRHNPELINVRGRVGKNAKTWDKVIAVIYSILLFATIILAALDARFTWSAVPLRMIIVGGIGLVLSSALTFWVMASNPFLSGVVQIQDDRGHYTVTGGPYRYVRHPMYAGFLIMFWSIPLLLGSWWALIPAFLNAILFVIRTVLEDKTLQAELKGYNEYTQKVRYRLIPGIW
jgi:protein-S-isoprenylcysteine O-methyltransferase Ste14